jgi:hypothetical protein
LHEDWPKEVEMAGPNLGIGDLQNSPFGERMSSHSFVVAIRALGFPRPSLFEHLHQDH